MAGILDPTPSYIILLGALILGAVGVGIVAGGTLSLFASIIVAGLAGFVAGMYASGEETEPVGAFVLTAALTGILVSFLPLDLGPGLVIFLAGFVIGARTRRR